MTLGIDLRTRKMQKARSRFELSEIADQSRAMSTEMKQDCIKVPSKDIVSQFQSSRELVIDIFAQ